MFQLLSELLTIQGEILNENLGKLRELGLGRMVNAFKQQYYDTGKGRDTRMVTQHISNKINHYSGIGPNSESIDCGAVTSWAQVKKLMKKNAGFVGAIFSVDNKVCLVLVGDIDKITMARGVCGMAWDFHGISNVAEEDIGKCLESVERFSPQAERYRASDVRTVHHHPLKSNHTVEAEDYWSKKLEVSHFEGIAQSGRAIPVFFDRLLPLFDSRMHMKLIMQDGSTYEKRSQRWKNKQEMERGLKLFADDLKTRLRKYKNSKIQTVADLEEFVKVVFSGTAKKINFGDRTYSAVPSPRHLGSNDSYKYKKKHESYDDTTMRDLFLGKEVGMSFEADRNVQQYDTLYIWVKFKDGQIIPTRASYRDPESHQQVQVTL